MTLAEIKKRVPIQATPDQIAEMTVIADVMISTVNKIDVALIYATGVRAASGEATEDAVRDDMANVGEALMEALGGASGHEFMKSWRPVDCPTEIVFDLLNAHDEISADRVRLQQLVDAYRLQAVNEGWNHRMADAYGRTDYLHNRIVHVDKNAERTVASGYDASAYLRDGLAKVTK